MMQNKEVYIKNWVNNLKLPIREVTKNRFSFLEVLTSLCEACIEEN